MSEFRTKSLLLVLLAISLLVGLTQCHSDDDDAGDDAAGPGDDDDNDNDDNDDAGDDDAGDGTLKFPDGFLFGAATSGFQIEMGCPSLSPDECTDSHSDWYEFVTSPATVDDPLAFVVGGDPATVGPGHYELYEADLDRAADELKHNGFRLGLEWSRIFPTSTIGVTGHENLLAVADAAAVAHYHQVFAALRERGLKPLVTLNHYTLPRWIHDGVGCHVDFKNCSPRGWVDQDVTVAEIAKYAGFVAREYGDEVDLWATLNEPLAVVLPGYLYPSDSRSNPPALFLRFNEFKTVMAAMIEGHARMVDAVRANDTVDADGDGVNNQVGVVYAMSPAVPKDPDSELDRQAAENVFYLWNMVFLNAVALGRFDENLDGQTVYREDLAHRLDFVGLNYYARITVSGLPFSLLPWLSPLMTFNPITMRIDEIYPRGIYEMAVLINEKLGVPVYITENNGRSDPADNWAKEKRYLVENLSWLWYAIEQGADVRGYFYWSLIDNYEWNQGMKQYGLYEVDPLTKARTARDIVAEYRAIAECLYLGNMSP
ncbi:MAG: glycoside hydrolase family 1 protein [Myxococcales bacterium]|nr:glycoside hydrolase family 1 protein [Myxococcales bacterium]